ncbi:outer membrane protein assembly factor BamB [Exilibacterium tricleocarpae]|uniref:Outer membrane protein assembly factor BamB n=1 Tax=Exilibacterium tricleocarpae TaxID=2591008 RepID=A0A545U8D0_9GAMM|nr:outer membrane protein assembly factor BamB [Exilibacterium tricleocarpae]TQV85726.1 outer membrane protein assembly factor BamB [Exilibacterium tricleocarpae]
MRRLTLALCAALIVGCSSTDSIDLEPAELVDFEATGKIRTVWSRNVGAGQDKRYTLLVPALAAEAVFAVDVKGRVTALNRSDGKRLWRTDLDTPVSGGVGAGSGLVLVGTYAGQVIALNQADGSELWRTQVSSEVLAPPQTNGDIVVAQTVDGKLVGLEAKTGARRWLYENTLPVLTLRGTGTPVLRGDAVYAGFANGKVIAVSASDGVLRWEQRVGLAQGRTELERVVDIDGSPMLHGDLVYAVSFQGRLGAFGRANGRVIWAQENSSFQNLAAGISNVYVVTDSDSVQAYQANSGELIWDNDQLVRRKVSAPQTFANYVAVGDDDGYLHVFSQADGSYVARRKLDGDGLRSPMIAAGDQLFALGNSGKLVALEVVKK